MNYVTNELALLGFPNPHAPLQLTRADNLHLFSRTYLGNMTVSDVVVVPDGQEFYQQWAENDTTTELTFDQTSERSQRPTPPEDRIYAIVKSPNYSLFWRRLEEAIQLDVQADHFIISPTFIATYGIPQNSTELIL